ncbi:MAG: T9SS type A sorting domain-containing protein [Bacteroidota bacterium]
MKLNVTLLATILLFSFADELQSQNVIFNDLDFKNLLLANPAVNTNGDDEIQLTEATAFSGKLELHDGVISDLTGLETFTALTELSFYSVVATDMDVSANTALERLMAGNLRSLRLGNNEALRYVFTDLNNFTTFNVDNTYLDTLLCWHNNFPMLINLDNATSLEYLSLNDNGMPLLDVSNLSNLKTLFCDVNALTNLDLSNNPALEYLECKLNPLQSLDVSQNPNLRYLGCAGTALPSIDLSQNENLKRLIIYQTIMSFLDLSQNENLSWLDCYGSSFELINLSNGSNTEIEYTDFRENPNIDCIQVDSEIYSVSSWTNVDSPALYSAACEGVTSSLDLDETTIRYEVYPNPTSQELNIRFAETQNAIRVDVYDSIGRNTQSAQFTLQSSIKLDLDAAAGVLFVKVTADGKQTNFSVVKE